MINALLGLLLIYIFYVTIRYAKFIWTKGNKFASIAIALLAVSNIAIPIFLKYKNFFMKILKL